MEKFSFPRSTILELASVWSEINPDRPVMIEDVSRYLEVIKMERASIFMIRTMRTKTGLSISRSQVMEIFARKKEAKGGDGIKVF